MLFHRARSRRMEMAGCGLSGYDSTGNCASLFRRPLRDEAIFTTSRVRATERTTHRAQANSAGGYAGWKRRPQRFLDLPPIRTPLTKDSEVLRVGTNSPSVDKRSGQILRGAFLRREPHPETGEKRDTQGLSVNLRKKRTEKQTLTDWPKCHLIAVLPVGSVRAASPKLDVVQTGADRVYHANITGLPERGPDVPNANFTEAERLATLLAKAARAVYIKGQGFLE